MDASEFFDAERRFLSGCLDNESIFEDWMVLRKSFFPNEMIADSASEGLGRRKIWSTLNSVVGFFVDWVRLLPKLNKGTFSLMLETSGRQIVANGKEDSFVEHILNTLEAPSVNWIVIETLSTPKSPREDTGLRVRLKGLQIIVKSLCLVLLWFRYQRFEKARKSFGMFDSLGYLTYCSIWAYQYSVAVMVRFIASTGKISQVLCPDNGCLAYFYRISHSVGLKVYDIQHAIITPWNTCYRCPADFKNAGIYFPSVILIWGEWWKRMISISSQIIIVGYPFHLARERIARDEFSRRKSRRLLVIFSRKNFNDLMIFTEQCIDLSESLEVRLRLRADQNRHQQLRAQQFCNTFISQSRKIKVSTNNDLYDDLNWSDGVLGINSSVLVESIGLSRPMSLKIGNYRELNEYAGKGLITLVDSPSQCFLTMRSPISAADSVWSENLFSGNFDTNLTNFLLSNSIRA